jgi:hypothetical protein
MSGIAPRTAYALIDSDAEFDKEKMRSWLEKTKEHLADHSTNVSWGDPRFEIRISEIQDALKRLG